jgi:ribonuclease HI
MSATYILAADGAAPALAGVGAFAWVAFRAAPTGAGLIGVNYASSENVTHFEMLLTGFLKGLTFLSMQAPGRVRIQMEGVYAPDGFFQHLDLWSHRQWRNSEGKPVAHAHLWKAIRDLRDNMSPQGFSFIDDRDAVFKSYVAAELANEVAKITMHAAKRGTHLNNNHPLGHLPDAGLETILSDIKNQKEKLDEDDLHYCS